MSPPAPRPSRREGAGATQSRGGSPARQHGEPLLVAIDGPSGVGKSTVAGLVARRLGLPFLSTGTMYRAVGLSVLERGIDPGDRPVVEALAESLDLRLERGAGERVEVLLDGEPVGARVRGTRVSEASSRVAVYPGVRRRLVRLQQEFGSRHGAVMEGRDIGTVVFPHTPHKFFLNAPLAVRIDRRYRQLAASGAPPASRDEVAAEVRRRDERDRGRSDSPLTLDDSYVELDTGELTAEEAAERMIERIRAVEGAA